MLYLGSASFCSDLGVSFGLTADPNNLGLGVDGAVELDEAMEAYNSKAG